jgi:protein SCO1/2
VRKLRVVLWVVVGIAVIGFAMLLVNQRRTETPSSEQITLTSFGGPFTLTGADGKPFSSASLKGKPYAIFFGFTHCPDVCPTTLARMVKLRKQLNAGERPFEILFVTVDPERDTPAEVGKYAALFNSPITGLTGSPAVVEQVKKQFGIYSKKVPDGQGGYSVNHTSTVLLFDKSGGFSGTISPEEADSMALAKLKRISA